jgi:hypothetical protein
MDQFEGAPIEDIKAYARGLAKVLNNLMARLRQKGVLDLADTAWLCEDVREDIIANGGDIDQLTAVQDVQGRAYPWDQGWTREERVARAPKQVEAQ